MATRIIAWPHWPLALSLVNGPLLFYCSCFIYLNNGIENFYGLLHSDIFKNNIVKHRLHIISSSIGTLARTRLWWSIISVLRGTSGEKSQCQQFLSLIGEVARSELIAAISRAFFYFLSPRCTRCFLLLYECHQLIFFKIFNTVRFFTP